MRWLMILAACTALVTPALAQPQQRDFGPPGRGAPPAPAAEQSVERLVDELRGVIRDAQRRRSQDPELIDELRRLVQRYDWPWRNTVLREEYRDRDMTRNPAWIVASGRFGVDPQLGMRSQQPIRGQMSGQPQQQPGGLGGVLGAVVDEMSRRQQGQQPPGAPVTDRAEAFVAQPFANAFAITVALNSRSRDGGRIEFGPYQGPDRRAGYRLVYNAAASPSLELIRASATGSGVVQSTTEPLNLDDGADHRIQWTRDRDGNMQVQVDGRAVMEALDRGVGSGFDGFTVANLGGDFAFRSVAIDESGERRRGR